MNSKQQPLEIQRFERGLTAYQEGRVDVVCYEWCNVVGEHPMWQERTPFTQVLRPLVHLPLAELKQRLLAFGVQEVFGEHIRYCCLALAVLLSPQQLEMWDALISFCKTISDVGIKEVYGHKAWALTEGVNVPDPRARWELMHVLTHDDKIELSERTAASFRMMRQQPEARGMPIRDYRDWAVTTWGVECTVVPCAIHWRSIWSPCWEATLLDKRGGRGSYKDFLEALSFARRFFPHAGAADQQKAQTALWLHVPQGESWFERGRVHTALGGLRVRSKSEVIIANLLMMQHIPFLYEKRLEASDGTFRVPDFTIVWRGQTYYWEHIGMLGNEQYLDQWEKKLRWYRRHQLAHCLVVSTEVEGINSDLMMALIHQLVAKAGKSK